jgi:hypothetical protein
VKTDIHFRPDLESLEFAIEAETEAEIAFLCWLRCTAPAWAEGAALGSSVRLTFRGSEASAAVLQYIRSSGLSQIGTPNLAKHEGN